MIRHCTKCGNMLRPEASFCSRCGTRVDSKEDNGGVALKREHGQQASSPKSAYKTAPRQSWGEPGAPRSGSAASLLKTAASNKKVLIGIFCAVCVVILVLIVALALLKNSNKGSSDLFGNKTNEIAAVIGSNNSVAALSLNDYISEYNAALRRTASTAADITASDSNYISCAKTLINKILKNPSTAEYNEAEVLETDAYGKAIIHLNVSAQNGFGGWVREDYYVCIKSYNASDETFTYHPYMYYVDGDSSSLYDTLKSTNDFGVDPADAELEGLIIDTSALTRDGSFAISPTQTLDCYKAILDYGIQFVYVDTKSDHVVSVQIALNDSSTGPIDKCKNAVAATVAAITNTAMSTAKDNVTKVVNLSNLSPTSTPTYFSDGFIIDCGYGFSGVDIAVTVANKTDYDSGLYWSPNNKEEYYENMADQYASNEDYDNAIVYYEQAQISGDKLLSAYYGKAEQSFDAGDLDTAGQYFENAGNYKDAAVRVLEVFYSAGQEHEKNKDYEAAIYSYSMAGDYSDAYAKYKECNFKQGESYVDNKQYLDATVYFEAAANYTGASEKYKEACYLYAEQQLLIGSTDSAATYYAKAGDYKDAATRMNNYYYEKGNDFLSSKDYINAAASFILAGTYSDAKEMVFECYYCYGKQQFELNYISEAIEYLSMCRGYKDTDEILYSYYYKEATEAFDGFLTAFANGDNHSISKSYEKATTYFVLCEGYKDSASLLHITEKLLYAKKYLGSLSSNQYGVFSLTGMTVSVNDNIVTLNVPSWTTYASVVCSMVLKYDTSANSFSAELNNMYAGEHITSKKNTKMVESLLVLFTDLNNVEDFITAYTDENSWSNSGEEASFSISYGGYIIALEVKSSNMRLHWNISASK